MLDLHTCFLVASDIAVQAGLDSLGAVELRNAVADRFSVNLPATAVFDHPSPATLAAFVAALMAPAGFAGMAPEKLLQGKVETRVDGRSVTGVTAISCSFPGDSNHGVSLLFSELHVHPNGFTKGFGGVLR